jgi:hypothetical protein
VSRENISGIIGSTDAKESDVSVAGRRSGE